MTVVTVVLLVALAVCLLSSVVMSALREYSISRLEERLEHRDEETRERYRRYSDVRELSILTATLLRGVGIAAAILATGWSVVGTQPTGTEIALSILSAFGLVFVVCVLIPELWAAHFAETLALVSYPAMALIDRAMRPFTFLVEALDTLGKRIFAVQEISEEDQLEDDILDGLASGQRESLVDPAQTEMIKSIFDFKDTDVDEIMTPRTDVVMIHVDTPLPDAVQQAIDCGHSRIPVFGANRDEILGVLYVKDFLKTWSDTDPGGTVLRDHLRKAFFVPESRRIEPLLAEMRNSRTHLAVILDEYGGCAGIVTIEDIIEEIVGEIEDEHDPGSNGNELITPRDGVVECSGLAHIGEIEDALRVKIGDMEEDLETVGGYVFARLGQIPDVDSEHVIGQLRFSVLAADERRISRLRVELVE